MSTRVIVFRRCGCVDGVTGRQLGRACRRLAETDHGSWYFAVQVPTVSGRRARHRHGGYPSPQAARAAGQAVVDSEPVDMASQAWTVSRWLQFWLGTVQLRPSTVNSYRQHIHRYLIPTLGRLRLDELTVTRVQACVDLLARRRTYTGDRISPATVDRIRATLRSALGTAVREGVLATSPMRSVKVTHPVRPHPVVWTERVAEWRRSGNRPLVAVWTLAQTARFLNAVKDDRLAGAWWLIALRGLRRGEVTGLRRTDLDSANAELSVHGQVIVLPGAHTGPPKSRAGNRSVALGAQFLRRQRNQLGCHHDDVLERHYVAQTRSDSAHGTAVPAEYYVRAAQRHDELADLVRCLGPSSSPLVSSR